MPRILVVDDEPGVLDMIQGHFGLRGFEVHTAEDGQKGIEICGQVQPDIVLLDFKMKKMDGDEVLPELRRVSPKSKVWIISACHYDSVKHRVDPLRADAYLEKPVSVIDLEKFVRATLS
jgi:two-component system response regulator AdeR